MGVDNSDLAAYPMTGQHFTPHIVSRWRSLTCHAVPAAIAVLLGVLVIGLFMDRNAVYISPVKIIPPTVVPGGTAYALFTFSDRSNGRCDRGEVHRWLTDSRGIVYTLTDVPVVQSAPSGSPIRVEFPVPEGISDGPAVYHARVERWCNQIQTLWPMRDDFDSPFVVDRVRGSPHPNE